MPGSAPYEPSARARAAQPGAPKRQTARECAARTYVRALPIVPVRARGLLIEGADGRRYLDCASGGGALALGHNHPVVLEAIRKVLDSGAPLQVMDVTTPVEDAFVTELLRTLPPGLADHARVRFCGPAEGDAVVAALALVRTATGRTRVVRCTDAPPPGVPRARDPRAPYDLVSVRVSGPGAHAPEALLDGVAGEGPPAALLVEPVSGEGRMTPAPDEWIRGLRRLTSARSVPLIADETATGVGRTGAFWAVEHSGITPDVLVLAEATGGSLPLTALVHHADLPVGEPLGGAFRGNQLALAAGAATLAHVREHRLAEHAAALGARILARLRELEGRPAGVVGAVRGRGLLIGMETAAPHLAAAIRRECLRRGLIVDIGGPCGDVVRLLPPLTVTEEQATAALDRLADAVAAVEAVAAAEACEAVEADRPTGPVPTPTVR
ncbi:aminotransferase class III-fold pyridoxal phosphate-dependent enzyme [Streptomyces tagetis]|uniref:Diaminobutyrate--2-oxoglutarate transaminase n=1 Tax=Streptomyces tagetis TaxID=2820809 RepID=A0A940XBC5_9ACTN|nr:aminotransferase class III-fold pyridoxal phosphate-dependent enzyme [Streptomyces sp. RG38]MBQ0824956.1 aminotransferase class III-fold pyridoxal phosphate-dependent enzyme [Streptomyces sp. RG38]